jgi:hypothetical protein
MSDDSLQKKLLLIWLCYPEPSGEVRHVTDSEENPFMEFYPDDEKQYVESFHKEIIKEARSPGKSIVVGEQQPWPYLTMLIRQHAVSHHSWSECEQQSSRTHLKPI